MWSHKETKRRFGGELLVTATEQGDVNGSFQDRSPWASLLSGLPVLTHPRGR